MRASSAYSLFDTESVWAILMRIAPPVMLAQLIQAMYNIVDLSLIHISEPTRP